MYNQLLLEENLSIVTRGENMHEWMIMVVNQRLLVVGCPKPAT